MPKEDNLIKIMKALIDEEIINAKILTDEEMKEWTSTPKEILEARGDMIVASVRNNAAKNRSLVKAKNTFTR